MNCQLSQGRKVVWPATGTGPKQQQQQIQQTGKSLQVWYHPLSSHYKTVFNITSWIFYVTLQAPVYALFPHTFTIFRSSGDLSTEPELEPKPAMDQLGGEGELLTATGFLDAKGQIRGLRYLRVLSPLTSSAQGR